MATSSEIRTMSMTPSEAAAVAAAAAVKQMNAAAKKDDVSAADLKAMMEEIKRLRMENEEFKKRQRPISFSVNERGAVSMHGLGKYPVTLYKVQWERIMANIEPLKEYIKDHESELN